MVVLKNVLQQFNIDGHNHKNIRKLKTLHKDIKFKKKIILHSVYSI